MSHRIAKAIVASRRIFRRRHLFCHLAACLLILAALPLASARAADLADYAISVGDELQLDFLDDDAVPYPLVVGGRGEVQLPFLGSFPVAGQSLTDAQAAMTARYVAQGVFVKPLLDLSIVKLRPFSVIGEVQSPGFFDYRADMTVEQAVGLAGGPKQNPGGEESRAQQRIALQGELVATDSRMVRVAVTAARLRAQLSGQDRITVQDVGAPKVSHPDTALIALLVDQENAIIAAERAHHDEDRTLIERAIDEATTQISLIEQQITAQTAQIKSYDDELASNAALSDRGLVAAPVRAQLLRRVADEQTALLRLETTLAATRRDLAGLKRELIGVQFRRVQDWRENLADAAMETAQLRATQDSLLDRIALSEDWTRKSADEERGLRVSFALRRRGPDGAPATLNVTETDNVLPGDVVIVSIDRPGLTDIPAPETPAPDTTARADTMAEESLPR